MLKGILYCLSACLIWGMIFVVPLFMESFTSVEIALGRYFFYGAISTLILGKYLLQKKSIRYTRSIWLKAFIYTLAASIGYYICVVLSLRYAEPAICALILGLSPIIIAFYGNWKQKEISYSKLFLPSALILIGLLLINVPNLKQTETPSQYLMGLCFGCLALIAWCWYVVVNARFLKQNPHVSSSEWSTLQGVTALFSVTFLFLLLAILSEDLGSLQKFTNPSSELAYYLFGCAYLGIFCSWVGTFLWNQASLHLPVSLAGQLTIFETIFGLLFVYTVDQRLPPLTEAIGIIILLVAIFYGIRATVETNPEKNIA
jgi:drug/metabolite transporter (DMT)-like permease